MIFSALYYANTNNGCSNAGKIFQITSTSTALDIQTRHHPSFQYKKVVHKNKKGNQSLMNSTGTFLKDLVLMDLVEDLTIRNDKNKENNFTN